jgi:hypothetical protein
MSDESQLQTRPEDGNSSLVLSSARSSLIARGRRDAALLTKPLLPKTPDMQSLTRRFTQEGDWDLAIRYLAGDVSTFSLQDYANALASWRRAAEAGDTEAQFILGTAYEEGDGVPKNEAEAVRWFRVAAAKGCHYSECHLGVAYAEGDGVPQDYREAVKWFTLAAAAGDDRAQFHPATAYADGRGVTQDYIQAHMWFNLAADINCKIDVSNLDALARKMTPQQIAEAQRLAREWKQTKQKQFARSGGDSYCNCLSQ